MRQAFVGTLLLIALLWTSLAGAPQSTRLRDAHLAWEHGDYTAALEGYLACLESPDSSRFHEEIAVRTGEIFRTIELTADGGGPRFSPDGVYVSYEVGHGERRRTRLARAEAPAQPLLELPGHTPAFSLDGSALGYVHPSAAARSGGTPGAQQERPAVNRVRIRHLVSGTERELETGLPRVAALALASDGMVLLAGGEAEAPDQIHALRDRRTPQALTSGEFPKVLRDVNAQGTAALFTLRAFTKPETTERTVPPAQFGIVAIPSGTVTMIAGGSPSFSADGRTLAYVAEAQGRWRMMVAPAERPEAAVEVRSGVERLDNPRLSRDGSRILFQMMPQDDWELYVTGRDGSGEERVTREIQHDSAQAWIADGLALGLVGEPRHRRAQVHDLRARTRTRLFHNNSVRTIAPEYEWVASPNGTRVLVVAERDGDTVSPERGVYSVDLTSRITPQELRTRLVRNLAAERALRERGARMYAPIADAVRRVLSKASAASVFEYEKALFDFDSKHVSMPGNAAAAEYLFASYASLGYKPEYQPVPARGALEGRTANVLATLAGTLNPELVYVVSSHYDSVRAGSGADDNGSGTAALLETARLLARDPQPATILFASFTGEESGLLGSREFVRRAVENEVRIVGAINNDMVGWANDQRMDSTIRYSNAGIRDAQHAAAMQFTSLITYDARYYKGTDAHAYYDTFGDIIGGIGSYPVLGNPHYHQPHDTLDTVNHQLVTEVAKTTAATLMLLASSPSPVKSLTVERFEHGTASLAWRPSPERGVTGYLVVWGPEEDPDEHQMKVTAPRASLKATAGTVVRVKAVNARGLESWDAARVVVGMTMAD